MKLFVSKDQKVVAALAAIYFPLIALVDPLGTVRLVALFVLILIFGSVLFRIVDRPPQWVRRSRLETLLQRWRIEEEVEDPKEGAAAARSRGSR
jgi:hypothetical protein